jgi:hypothetical protein
MNKTKAYLGCLGNFLLGSLGVVGVGWFILLKYPKATSAVYTIGGILILMIVWSAYDEINKKLKQKNDKNAPIDVKAIDVAPEEDKANQDGK